MEYMIGVIVSLVVQLVKRITKADTFGSYVLLFIFSLLGGLVYYILQHSGHWQAIVQIVTVAAAFHNLIIRRFEKDSK